MIYNISFVADVDGLYLCEINDHNNSNTDDDNGCPSKKKIIV